MSDGGGESGRRSEDEPKKRTGGDDFGRAVARKAVAQISESSGFEATRESALEALSDIAIRYIRDLGRSAHSYASLAGRTDCNLFDIVQGLEDLVGSAHGFSGASNVNHCLLDSGTLRDIMEYVQTAEEIPFVQPIPRFPIVRSRKSIPSFAQLGEIPPAKHIPDWLPGFPDVHTYVHTPVWNDRTTDPKTDKMEQAKQRRKAERSLLNLQQLLANGSGNHVSVDSVDEGNGRDILEANQFLAPPLQSSVKGISPVRLPDKLSEKVDSRETVSLLEAFAPAIEAAKSEGFDAQGSERKILPSKRSTVHFKFGMDKRSVGTPLASSSVAGRDKITSWFGRDDDKDDKKRRAEQILREAMENEQESAQS